MELEDLLVSLRRESSQQGASRDTHRSFTGLMGSLVFGPGGVETFRNPGLVPRLRGRTATSLSTTIGGLAEAWVVARKGLRQMGVVVSSCGDEICRLLPRARPNSLASFVRATDLPAARQAVSRAWIAVNEVRSKAPEEDRRLFDPILNSVAHFGRLLRDLERNEISLDSESILVPAEWMKTPPGQTSIFEFFDGSLEPVSDEEQAYSRSMSSLRLDEEEVKGGLL